MVNELDLVNLFYRVARTGKSADTAVSLPKTGLRDLIKLALADQFDEEWYLSRHKDVAEAVRKGAMESGLEHYASVGIYEGRLPYEVRIDELDYLNRHRDVAKSVKEGTYASGLDHFLRVGFLEGRHFRLEEAAASADDAPADAPAAEEGSDRAYSVHAS